MTAEESKKAAQLLENEQYVTFLELLKMKGIITDAAAESVAAFYLKWDESLREELWRGPVMHEYLEDQAYLKAILSKLLD